MRTAAALATGIAIGLASACAVYLAMQPRETTTAVTARATPPATEGRQPASPVAGPARSDEAAAQVATSRPSRTRPVTPDYGPAPDGTRPIFRCTSRGGTVYSNEPCAGATVIDGASAVGGYDTRPSDRLARLVADGRAADVAAGGGSGPSFVGRSGAAPVTESAACANLRQQVRDIDAATLQPARPETLDEWRRIRQDIRTSMARNHC